MIAIAEALEQARTYHRVGQLALAESLYRRILEADPAHGETCFLLGVLCQAAGRLSEAVNYLQQAARLTPREARVYNSLGVVLAAQGKTDEAIACYHRAIELRPNFVAPRGNLGNVLRQQGKLDEAAACYRQVLELEPGSSEAHNNLGVLLQAQGNLDEAAASFRRAVELHSDFAEAYVNLGVVLKKQGNLDEAVRCYCRVLELQPDHAAAQNNLGLILHEQGKLEEAIACYRRLLKVRPDYAEAHNNLGLALEGQGKRQEAVACYQRAIQLRPNFAHAHNNLGALMLGEGRPDEALACYRRALEFEPQLAVAHYSQAVVLLLNGDFDRGWPEYQWRQRIKWWVARRFPQPAWDGGNIEGKTILVHQEQGFGDTIQFVRYVPLVQQRGARVILECQRPLLRLFNGCAGVDQLVGEGDELPPFDVQTPLLSLPGIFHAGRQNVPADVPYLFAAPPLVEKWRARLSGLGGGFKIGINWQGNTRFQNDQGRSIPLANFALLAEVAGVRLFSLQKRIGTEQLAEVRHLFPIVDFAGELDEASGPFMDTAAIMMNLDLVVTSDTSVAHLAGALGVPVWVVLRRVPDWRWLLDRSDSPWYPTMRLFRQRKTGDWQGVFEEIRTASSRRLASSEAGR